MEYQTEFNPDDKLLSLQEVISLTGLTRSRIYDLMNSLDFPRPIKISRHRVAWIEGEIYIYLNKRIAERNVKFASSDEKEICHG